MDAASQDELLAALGTDHTQADVADADRAMLDYALKLTLSPGDVVAADLAALREHGFDDRAIHDLCVVVAYFAFANRVADGLGVQVESAD